MEISKVTEQAIQAFEKHHVFEGDRNLGRWFVAKPYKGTCEPEGNMAFEVVCLRNGRIFVGGDIDDVTFGYHSCHPEATLEQRHLNRVAWMGKCESMGYVQEKAQIGMTDNGRLTEAFNSEKAIEEIQWQLDELDEEDEHLRDSWEEAKEMVEYGCHHQELAQHIYDTTDDAELCSIGMTIAPRVIYGWAALRRLSKLLGL